MMDGYLLIDKPTGLTSHDVVAKIRRILRQAKSPEPRVHSKKELSAFSSQLSARAPKVRVGHTGTLDPLASGLLILVLGSYTKRAGEFSKLDKTYEVELTLGFTSKTGDSEGPIEPFDFAQGKPSPQETEKILKSFVGEVLQIPHAHSAVKVGGQRAYKLARAGKEVKIEPRKVRIYDIRNTKYEYPKLWFTTTVSSGTYIRSLAEDIGQKLGTGAYLSSLRRTSIGKYDVGQVIPVEAIDRKSIERSIRSL